MAVSQFAVVYDAATLAVRMVFAPDDDAELQDPFLQPAGCLRALIPAFAFEDFRALYAGAKRALPSLRWQL